MGNVVLGKNATATNFVAPFTASKAVDGQYLALNRWVGNVPCALMVDLGFPTWINRWVVTHMSSITGWNRMDYAMSSYSFQGSNDQNNWVTLDSVSGNTMNRTDRTFVPVQYRFVRVLVNSGLNANKGVASILELEVYDVPPTSQYLTALTINSGTLVPTFAKNTYAYTASVDNSVASLVVTPTAETPSAYGQNATIKITSGAFIQTVISEQAVTVPLAVGVNTINVEVTSAVGWLKQVYTVVVTRASSAYLTNVIGIPNMQPSPFDKTENLYTGNTASPFIKITPTAEDLESTITVNGTPVTSGQQIKVDITGSSTQISIVVTSKVGGYENTYIFNIAKP